jgi:hypothetical protein
LNNINISDFPESSAQPIGWSKASDDTNILYFYDGHTLASVNEKYYRYIRGVYRNPLFKISKDGKSLAAFSNNEIVGFIAPVLLEEIPENIGKFIKEFKPTLPGPEKISPKVIDIDGVKIKSTTLSELDKIFGIGKNSEYSDTLEMPDKAAWDGRIYEKAKPLLKSSLEDALSSGKTAGDLFKILTDRFGERIKPYLREFIKDVRNKKIDIIISEGENDGQATDRRVSGIDREEDNAGKTPIPHRTVETGGSHLGGEPLGGESGSQAGGIIRDDEHDGGGRQSVPSVSEGSKGVEGQRSHQSVGDDNSRGDGYGVVSDTTKQPNYDLREKPELKLTKGQRKHYNDLSKEILKKADSEITEEDKEILRNYTGEGGLSTGVESLTQYYTDYPTIRAIYRAIESTPLKIRKALEPGAGNGNFIGHNPDLKWTAVEIDPTNSQILRVLYPQSNIYTMSYERFKDSGFDLIAGNVFYVHESFGFGPSDQITVQVKLYTGINSAITSEIYQHTYNPPVNPDIVALQSQIEGLTLGNIIDSLVQDDAAMTAFANRLQSSNLLANKIASILAEI